MSLYKIRDGYEGGGISKSEYINQMHEAHKNLFEYAEFIKSTDIGNIEITDGLITMTSRAAGIRMLFDKRDKRVIPIEILNFREYEKAESNLMWRLIDPGAIVFDVGANIGWHSMNIAKRVKGVKVHAFEPLPQTFRYLTSNVEINRLTNIDIHNFGFYKLEGELTFYYYSEGSGNASAENVSENPEALKVVCNVNTLDGFIAETALTVDFIKCDVEGAELFVFQGGLKTLQRHCPIIFTEMLRKWSAKFNYHPNEIIKLLREIGYHCFVVRGNHLLGFDSMDENTVDTNFLFMHVEKHSEKIKRLLSLKNDQTVKVHDQG